MNTTIDFVQDCPGGLRIVISGVPCGVSGSLSLEAAERVESILDWVMSKVQQPFPAPATMTLPYDLDVAV